MSTPDLTAMPDPLAAEQLHDLQLGGPAGPSPNGRRRSPHLWILRRLGLAVVTLLAISLLIFIATRLLPGDAAQAILGRTATPERVAVLRAELGLDRPFFVQYWSSLTAFFTGDARSLSANVPVYQLLGSRIGNTLVLLVLAAVISIPLAVLIGVLAAIRPSGLFGGFVNVASIVLAALPEFVTGILLVMAFATTWLTVLPAVAVLPPGDSIFQHLDVLVLPVATLTLSVLPYLVRQVRGSMTDVLASEYVMNARLKGLSPRTVLFRHALRNGLVPTVQSTALTLAYLLGGVVVVEFLFQYQGLGTALVDAVGHRDLPVLQTVVLLLGSGYILLNLAADILTVYLTPRLRTR